MKRTLFIPGLLVVLLLCSQCGQESKKDADAKSTICLKVNSGGPDNKYAIQLTRADFSLLGRVRWVKEVKWEVDKSGNLNKELYKSDKPYLFFNTAGWLQESQGSNYKANYLYGADDTSLIGFNLIGENSVLEFLFAYRQPAGVLRKLHLYKQEVVDSVRYDLDGAGKLVAIIGEGNNKDSVLYTRNENGIVIESQSFMKDPVHYSIRKYVYHPDGNIKEIQEQSDYGTQITTMVYNEYGDAIEMKQKGDIVNYLYQYQYEYDSQKNWTRKTTECNGRLFSVAERKIEYYN